MWSGPPRARCWLDSEVDFAVARNAKVPGFVNALQAMSDGKMVPVPGGVLIRDANGQLLGAVGISGETSDNDELCAMHGVKSVGLVPDVN